MHAFEMHVFQIIYLCACSVVIPAISKIALSGFSSQAPGSFTLKNVNNIVIHLFVQQTRTLNVLKLKGILKDEIHLPFVVVQLVVFPNFVDVFGQFLPLYLHNPKP